MNKSDTIKNLSEALLKFHGLVGTIKKDASNPFFKSKYASLSNVLEGIQAPLMESGLVFSQFPSGTNGLSSILIHSATGEWLEDTYIMPVAKQNDPQAVGSAITYARRYALASILGLNIDDDDDGNAAAQPPNPKQEQPKQEQPQQPNLKIEYTLDIVKAIDKCTTSEQVEEIWEKNIPLQKNPQFIEDIRRKGSSLKPKQ